MGEIQNNNNKKEEKWTSKSIGAEMFVLIFRKQVVRVNGVFSSIRSGNCLTRSDENH